MGQWDWSEDKKGNSARTGSKTPKRGFFPRGKRLTGKEFISVVKQMANMLKSGLQIVDVLTVLEENRGKVGQMAREWKEAVLDGKPFHEAIHGSVKGIPPEFSAIIRAGEESGTLVNVITVYVRELERQDRIERKKRSALMYPSIVLAVVGIVLVIMFGFALPRLKNVFIQTGVSPSGLSYYVFGMSDLVVRMGMKKAMVFALLFGLWIVSPGGREMVMKMFSVVPAVRRLAYFSRWALFSSIMGTSLTSGMSLPQSLTLAKHVAPKELVKKYDAVTEGVYRGRSLIDPETCLWPPITKGFIRAGLQSGNLADAFLSIGEYFSAEAEELAASLTTALEPAILLFLVFTVGLIPIAMVQTMAQMYMALLKTV